jgi:hypothetical protein
MVVELYSIYIVVMGWGGPFGCPARSVVEHVIPVVLNLRPQSSATCGEFSPCSIPGGEFKPDFIDDTR